MTSKDKNVKVYDATDFRDIIAFSIEERGKVQTRFKLLHRWMHRHPEKVHVTHVENYRVLERQFYQLERIVNEFWKKRK